MLSTFILMPATGDAPPALGALVRTLGALVPAIVEGLVRDVTVIAPNADAGVRRIADHAGCDLVENADFDAALREGIAKARSPIVFLLRAGAFLDRAFLDEAARQFGPERNTSDDRSLLIREAPDGLVTRVLPDLAPVAGVIASKAALAYPFKDFEALVKRQRAAQTLQSRASMAK
jgi:hypothetical protein